MVNSSVIKKIVEKLKGLRTAMLVTITESGQPHARPMSTQEIDPNGVIWFITHKESDKIKHIEANSQVALLYGDGNAVRFVSLLCKAEIDEDKEKVKELWTDFHKAWFKNENDPSITLLKLTIEGGEYWDYPGGKVGAYIDMAKSAITGDQSDNGENETFKL